ncbi:polysaccharide biosynthesis tyrosine autokinase [Burkholderia thailandensis]|uniref:Putative tyrosine-protein kinase EpsB n=1 Tax=Burkholderia thailandensis (strain ATCC 700388 / DSM 13276 / CCUG 48851 / CIP 106301 / E264) TaxID=271848 RepID=Q2SYU8_BURTA|nr:polysaccharide biosynthesis tyrosine autokinase [Burkholderia thailandensis]ABC39525.1 exopolysaccharide tyrosine-protein kinase, putative [Burkholderia thailandensis E264]AHI72709.1 exopolysaccharide transport family protein [Burkholderia thailandensis 2002721723]AIP24985.1 exopolysaccharide transport family protein [Burkholderia thailandensis E264]AIS94416.1 exopolysaccharide transport family protein [Burkholderia thailandensis MSMB59]AIT22246.1 exopolysaccharide transport family protein 
MNPNPTGTSALADSEGDTDFVAVLDILIEGRWLIAAIALGCFVVGVAYAVLSKPVYQADILIQVEDSPDTSAAKSLLGDVSSLFDVKSSAAAETQILASRLVVSRAVDNLKLFIDAKPKRFPVIGNWLARRSEGLSNPGLAGFGGYAWGQERINVATFDVPRAMEGDTFELTMLDARRYRLAGGDLERNVEGAIGTLERFSAKGGAIVLRVDAVAAKPGATFVLVRHSRLRTIEDLQDNLDVQERVKQSDVVVASLRDTDPDLVSSALNEIGRQYIAQNIQRKSAEAAQSLEFLNGQLPALKRQLTDSEARLTKLRDEHGTVDLTEEAKLALAQSADAKTRLLELRQKRQEALSRFTPKHPSVIAIDQQIAALDGYRGAAEQQIKRLPDLQQQLVRLMLDVKVNTDLYTALLNNMQQLQLVRAGKVGNVRLVDTAAVPEVPVKPKKALVALASLLLGVLAGCGTAVGRSMLFHGISDPNEIERRLGLNVYATVPRSDQQRALTERAKRRERALSLLSVAHPDEPAVESLRSLRTALQFAMLDARNNVVVIAGPAPGVGKSFVSANLAAVLTMAGKRVLLIDGDIRKGHLNDYLGLARGKGFSELIAGSAQPDEVLHRDVIVGLDFISTGAMPKHPAELLLHPRLPELIGEFSKHYDVVLIDSPPVLAVADTGILAATAGTAFLVALAGSTKLGEIAESAKRLAQNGVRLSGVVFNGINPRLGQYGYGSKYGGYRYVAYEYGAKHDA